VNFKACSDQVGAFAHAKQSEVPTWGKVGGWRGIGAMSDTSWISVSKSTSSWPARLGVAHDIVQSC
jgi:hypothetical protein